MSWLSLDGAIAKNRNKSYNNDSGITNVISLKICIGVKPAGGFVMKRKWIVSMVALILCFSMSFGSVALAADFTDLDQSDSATVTAIERLADLGIVDGYTDNTFKPQQAISRAEFTKIANLTFNELRDDAATQMYFSFADVRENAWYNQHLQSVCNRNLMEGSTDGNFYPERNITGNEVIAVLCRILGYTSDKVEGSWPTNYQNLAKEIGMLDGLQLDLAKALTRGEVCLLVSRTLDLPLMGEAEVSVEGLGIIEKIDQNKNQVRIVDLKNSTKTYNVDASLLKQLKENTLVNYEITGDQLVAANTSNISQSQALSAKVSDGAVTLNGKQYQIAADTKVYLVGGKNNDLSVSSLSAASIAASDLIRGVMSSNLNFAMQYVSQGSDLQVLLIYDYGSYGRNLFGYAETAQVYVGSNNLAMNFFGDEVLREVIKTDDTIADEEVAKNVLYQYWVSGNDVQLAPVDRSKEEIQGQKISSIAEELYTTEGGQFILSQDSVVMKISYEGTLAAADFEVTAVDYDYTLAEDDVVWVRYMIDGDDEIEAAYVLVFEQE